MRLPNPALFCLESCSTSFAKIEIKNATFCKKPTLWLTATLAAVSITLLPKVALTQGCWMQTSNGRIDLGYLCRGSTSRLLAHPPREGTTPKPIKPVGRVSIFVSELRYEGDLLVGRVTNAGDRAVDRVRVYYEVVDNSGRIAGAGWNYTTPESLQPGQTVVFRVWIPAGGKGADNGDRLGFTGRDNHQSFFCSAYCRPYSSATMFDPAL